MKKIPAAATTSFAARTAARRASGCGIDSSHPQETRPRTPRAGKAPERPCVTVEDEAFCTVTTVHRGERPGKGCVEGSRKEPASD
jgi:hypothetical protein